ncbi:MAG: hypothetical protein IJ042_07175, partial [Butyricicoccus sp.]|nr:hypothetical protein [Butyricicoccus sp.]
VRAHYRATCDAAPKLDGESAHASRMREMFVLNLGWFMATLLEGKVAGGYRKRRRNCAAFLRVKR